MTLRSTTTLIVALFGLLILGLVTIGPPGPRPVHAPVENTVPDAPPSVAANGFALSSAEIALPDDAAQFPDGPHADVVNANCTSCHSASMATTQPTLTTAQWRDTVEKMRHTYKAPVAETDVPAIVAYLTAMPGQAPQSKGASRPVILDAGK